MQARNEFVIVHDNEAQQWGRNGQYSNNNVDINFGFIGKIEQGVLSIVGHGECFQVEQ